jgi:hypothetical protein
MSFRFSKSVRLKAVLHPQSQVSIDGQLVEHRSRFVCGQGGPHCRCDRRELA